MFNKITTTLVAKDEVSPKLKDLQGNLKNTGVVSQGLGVVAKGAFVGVAAGVAAVGAGVVGLGLAFNQASGIAQNALSAANNLNIALSGSLGLDQSQSLIEGISKELALSAAALPGTTQEYVDAFFVMSDEIAEAYKNPDGTLNVEGFKRASGVISETMGVLFSGEKDRGKVNTLIDKMMSGNATLTELMQYDAFASNKGLVKELEKAEKERGKSWKDFTAQERVATMEAISPLLVSPEYLEELKNSAAGILAGFQSSLFDPKTGIFGIMRELEGGGSVFKSLTQTVRLLFGSSGLISTMVNDLFGVVDPMEVLKQMVDRLNGTLEKLRPVFAKFPQVFEQFYNLISNFSFGTLGNFSFDLATPLAAVFNSVVSYLSNLDLSAVFSTLGNLSAELLNNFISFLTQIDYSQLGVLLMNGLGALAAGIGAFLSNLDAQTILLAAGAIALKVAIPLLAAKLVAGLAVGFGSGLVAGLMSLGTVVLGSLSAPILLGVAAVGLAIWGVFKYFDIGLADVKNFIMSGVDLIGQALKWLFDGAVNFVKGQFDLVKNSVTLVIDAIRNAFNWIGDKLRRIPGLGGIGGGNSSPATPSNSFNGNFPGVFGAIARELINSPSGARPVIANSSEMILNRQQQAALFGGFSRGAANSSSNQTTIALGGISIQAGQNQSPVEIANTVIREIENRLVRAYQV